ncbi:alpha/beta hydrolase [Streptomyces sp. NPDC050560]|uniref:alpha/beta hydrolase n=1 Tax=Streptomyces sp. NPDC050560 TaxID=3365630 RepID=UPI00379C4780
MPDDAAARDAAEEESALAHPAVPPDATAAYGDHPDQVVDFYAPRGETPLGGPAPLVVVLHGGAWRAPYDRAHISPFAHHLTRGGLAVASVEYRRGPALPVQGGGLLAGSWPETFDDVAAAFDALPTLAPKALPGIDTRRTVAVGHSAGGQLALWAAARHVLPEGSPWCTAEPAELRGVVALAPIADLTVARDLGVCGGAVDQLLGGAERFEERRAQVDPAALVPTGIATTLVQGREDGTVPVAVAEAYAGAAAAAGEPVGVTLLDGVGHFAGVDPAADACAVVVAEVGQLVW